MGRHFVVVVRPRCCGRAGERGGRTAPVLGAREARSSGPQAVNARAVNRRVLGAAKERMSHIPCQGVGGRAGQAGLVDATVVHPKGIWTVMNQDDAAVIPVPIKTCARVRGGGEAKALAAAEAESCRWPA